MELRVDLERRMTGYFTLLKFVLWARSLDHLEDILGYRRGRLSTKGLLIYRFMRLPEISEFEVRGSSIIPKHRWEKEDLPLRKSQLAAVATYHQNTAVPDFDVIQRRNARATMTLSGGNLPIKVYPVDWQAIDDTANGYPHGCGIAQWRLTDEVARKGAIRGALLFQIEPSDVLPWLKA